MSVAPLEAVPFHGRFKSGSFLSSSSLPAFADDWNRIASSVHQSFQLFDFALIALAISGSLLKTAEYFSQSL
jgi:hypothetical protein